MSAFLSTAAWRAKPPSEAQLKLMEKHGLISSGNDTHLTSGEAAESISRHFLRLASEEQHTQLQAMLGPGAALPVPLLQGHAEQLLKRLARTDGGWRQARRDATTTVS